MEEVQAVRKSAAGQVLVNIYGGTVWVECQDFTEIYDPIERGTMVAGWDTTDSTGDGTRVYGHYVGPIEDQQQIVGANGATYNRQHVRPLTVDDLKGTK